MYCFLIASIAIFKIANDHYLVIEFVYHFVP